jgi:hypothetical protein
MSKKLFEWKISEKPKTDGNDGPIEKNAVYQSGSGKYHINIANAYNVSLNTGQ